MDDLKLRGDFLLVKEVNENEKIAGTNLNMKYDDNSHFMVAEIVGISSELTVEYAKYYNLTNTRYQDLQMLLSPYKVGQRVILQRIAKVPYKDGLFFVSFKDILAFITKEKVEEPKLKQVSLFEREW